MSLRILYVNNVIITDPAYADVVLKQPKDKFIYRIFNALTSPDGRSPNLLGHLSHDGYWKLVRKGAAPAFSPRNIRGEFPHLMQVVDRLSEVLTELGPDRAIDIDNLLQRESMDVIGKVGFNFNFQSIDRFEGRDARDQPDFAADDMFGSLKGAAEEITRRWNEPFRQMLRHVLPSARRGGRALADVQKQMRRLLTELGSRGLPAANDTSIAAHLRRLKDPATGAAALDDGQLAGELGLFLFAGFETTGHTMAWALALLCWHPEALLKVEKELEAHGLLVAPHRPTPRQLTYADLSALSYLGQVIKEAMRLVPVVAGGTMRTNPEPLQLGGYTIPAGTSLLYTIYGVHLSERNWERPHEFLPERWTQPDAQFWQGDISAGKQGGQGTSAGGGGGASLEGLLKSMDKEDEPEQRPRRFLPFSAGPRSCIGQNLAAMNYTATLAVLLSRFKFELPEELRGEDALWGLQRNLITNQPSWKGKEGLPMRCVPRAA